MTQRNFRVRNGLTIDGTTSGSSSFASTATGTDLSYVLPGSQGAANTTLTNDGSGNLSWALPGGGGSTFGNVTVGVATDQTISTTSGNLILDSTSGTIIMNSNGTLGVTLTPIAGQTPNAVFNGNMVKGVIRNATTEAGGAVWSYLAGGGAFFKGLSIDNSADTGRGSIAVLRAYGGTKASFISEVAAGTFASPTAITSGTLITELAGSGYNGTAFTSDNLSSNLPSVNISATQNWTDFVSTGSSISGTTLTIGTLVSGTVAAGQMIYGTGVTTATSIVSGSGSTWTVDKSQTIGPIQIQGGAQGTRLLVRAQSSGTRQSSSIGQGTAPLSIIDHQPTAATYIADAWTFRSRPVNTGGTNTTLMTLDATGNAVHAGDVAVNGGDLTTTQTTATLFNTNATTLNIGGAATAVSIGAGSGTTTINNATTILSGDLRVNGNDILSSTGAIAITLATNDVTITDYLTVGGNLEVRSGTGSKVLDMAAGASENTLTVYKTNAAASADHAVINFATYRSTAGTYSPTQNGDKLGEFKFNGQYASGASPTSGVPAQILSNATENWTATANGQAIQFWGTKAGTTTGVNVINANPETMFLRSDLLTINDSANVNLVGNNITYNRVYGQWQNLNTVTPAGSNTAYAFALPTQDFANISSVVSTSRITPGAAGMYKLQFSVQVQNDDTADEHVAYFWWRKNGTDVPGSMGRVGVFKAKGAVNGLTIAGWDNMISSANTTDYWELMYAVDDATHVDFPTFAATAFGPATASLFVTLVPIGA